jgi:hypothetical protein
MAGSGLSRSVLPASTNSGKAGQTWHTFTSQRRPPQDIDGLLAWAAGTDSSGLHVVTVWQSKAHMDRWSAEQLFPAFQSLGMTDVASNMESTEYDADELYIR